METDIVGVLVTSLELGAALLTLATLLLRRQRNRD